MKTLLFGPAGAGKTSLMKTTCLGYSFVKIANLKPTKGISRENFLFRGLLELSIWDAGGQERYFEKYFSESSKPIIFAEVSVPIFMVEAVIIKPQASFNMKVRNIFDEFLTSILEFSPKVKKIYVLINKIDLEDSKTDEVYKLLTDGLDPKIREKIAFTPVSVKSGSAQHRLIEVLDSSLQNSILEMQKMSKIRSILEKIKEKTFFDLILFNLPDGLITSSTLAGKFETEPLKFMKLEMGSLESNIHSVYSKIMTLAKKEVHPIKISMLTYESKNSYVYLKEVGDNAVLLLISPEKKKEYFSKAIEIFTEQDEIRDLEKHLKLEI
ncbi:MAG: ADP-ribosylation factor-like protein [Promethearchaeota archaeon]